VRQDVAKPANESAGGQYRTKKAHDHMVSIPAKTSVMPGAKTIGHAVGEGSSTESAAFSRILTGCSDLIFRSSP